MSPIVVTVSALVIMSITATGHGAEVGDLGIPPHPESDLDPLIDDAAAMEAFDPAHHHPTPYAILGVTHDATKQEIEEAFHQRLHLAHHDVNEPPIHDDATFEKEVTGQKVETGTGPAAEFKRRPNRNVAPAMRDEADVGDTHTLFEGDDESESDVTPLDDEADEAGMSRDKNNGGFEDHQQQEGLTIGGRHVTVAEVHDAMELLLDDERRREYDADFAHAMKHGVL